MTPVRSVIVVVLGAAVLLAGYWLSQEQRLTILVISLDTTRPDHLTAYGYDRETTPTLARLAREGAVFTQARAPTSWTLPSHMSLFTGLPPDLHGVNIDFQRLDRGHKTMGQVFKEADFRTIGLYTAPYVHERFGFGRGMDFYEQMTVNPTAYDLTPEEMDRQLRMREMMSHRERTSRRVTDNARRLLRERARPRTFMFLHYFDPHYDFLAPPEIVARFADPAYSGSITGEQIMDRVDEIHADMPAEDLAQLLALYDAEIRFVDDHLGLLLKTLENQDLLDSTLIVVVGDHGEEFFENGQIGHRRDLSEEVLQIPMIFWGPGRVPAGLVVEDDVALYDVLPTLMDYAGLPAEPRQYGRSLRPLMEGERLPHRATSACLTFLHPEGRDHYTRHEAVVRDGLKYVRSYPVPWSREKPTVLDNEPDLEQAVVQVFDLREDPLEEHDLYAREPEGERVRAAIALFEGETERQLAALRDFVPLGTPALPSNLFDPARVDPEAALQAVGYLGR